MNIRELFTNDESAVSPVIGVILMVAITVILAAVIATFVLGLGDSLSDSAPQASFSFDWEGTSGGSPAELTVKHAGGNSIQASNLHIRGDSDGGQNVGVTWDTYSSVGANSDVSSGARANFDVGPEAEIDVVWQNAAGDNSATLSSWSGPDA